ncbi:MAG TPA: class I SAM-dependent methyltransferase [Thermodesulfobacteriota bacterium]|nr:class I SAM-dependent methyltransferase [Thermodesulfobacteriota bacterium]
MTKREIPKIEWTFGALPFAMDKTHDKVIGMMDREPRGKVLDIPTGTGILADRLRKMGFEMSCCDINPSFFSVPDLKVEIGDLNQSLPYADDSFDYVICLEGIEHTENPSNAIREFQRILKKGGKVFISTPNFLNIERRIRFFFHRQLFQDSFPRGDPGHLEGRSVYGSFKSSRIFPVKIHHGMVWVSNSAIGEGSA